MKTFFSYPLNLILALAIILSVNSTFAQKKITTKTQMELEMVIKAIRSKHDDDQIFQSAKKFENVSFSSKPTEKQKEVESALALAAVLLAIDQTGGVYEFFPVLYRKDKNIFRDTLKSSDRIEIRKNKQRLEKFLDEIESVEALGNG